MGENTEIVHIRKKVHDLADFVGVIAGDQRTLSAQVLEKFNTISVRLDANSEQRNRMEEMLRDVRQFMMRVDERQDRNEAIVADLRRDVAVIQTQLQANSHQLDALEQDVKRIEVGAPDVSALTAKQKAALWTIGITFLLGALEFLKEAVEFVKLFKGGR